MYCQSQCITVTCYCILEYSHYILIHISENTLEIKLLRLLYLNQWDPLGNAH